MGKFKNTDSILSDKIIQTNSEIMFHSTAVLNWVYSLYSIFGDCQTITYILQLGTYPKF